MKINEAEELLGISKANIRFYEKEGLLTPRRSENRYRDYTNEDLDRLLEIIILRKMGLSVQDIGRILLGELPLQEAMTANIASLEEQISQLTGALKLSKQIRTEELTELDTPRYWEIIHAEEQQGGRFFEIASEFWNGSDHWNGVKWIFYRVLCMEPEDSWRTGLKNAGLLILLFSCLEMLTGKPINWSDWLLYALGIIGIAASMFPIYLLHRKHPRAAEYVMGCIVAVLCLFFAALIVLIIVLSFNSHYHFWY